MPLSLEILWLEAESVKQLVKFVPFFDYVFINSPFTKKTVHFEVKHYLSEGAVNQFLSRYCFDLLVCEKVVQQFENVS